MRIPVVKFVNVHITENSYVSFIGLWSWRPLIPLHDIFIRLAAPPPQSVRTKGHVILGSAARSQVGKIGGNDVENTWFSDVETTWKIGGICKATWCEFCHVEKTWPKSRDFTMHMHPVFLCGKDVGKIMWFLSCGQNHVNYSTWKGANIVLNKDFKKYKKWFCELGFVKNYICRI